MRDKQEFDSNACFALALLTNDIPVFGQEFDIILVLSPKTKSILSSVRSPNFGSARGAEDRIVIVVTQQHRIKYPGSFSKPYTSTCIMTKGEIVNASY